MKAFVTVILVGLVLIGYNQYERRQPVNMGTMEIIAIDCRDTGDCIDGETSAQAQN